jgi:hemoglobin
MGEANLFALCREFYARLEETELRSMFPADMAKASEKLAAFLVGLCGGPPVFQEKYGDPRMRQRHLRFPIDDRARLIWLNTFKEVLRTAPERFQFPVEHLPTFEDFLTRFSAWMVNRQH